MPGMAIDGLHKVKSTLKHRVEFYEYVSMSFCCFLGGTLPLSSYTSLRDT